MSPAETVVANKPRTATANPATGNGFLSSMDMTPLLAKSEDGGKVPADAAQVLGVVNAGRLARISHSIDTDRGFFARDEVGRSHARVGETPNGI
jgi:hypothetical protein